MSHAQVPNWSGVSQSQGGVELNEMLQYEYLCCLCRPVFMFQSHSMSIAIELTTSVTLEEVEQGVVGLLVEIN
jgi:hypothetical protein